MLRGFILKRLQAFSSLDSFIVDKEKLKTFFLAIFNFRLCPLRLFFNIELDTK